MLEKTPKSLVECCTLRDGIIVLQLMDASPTGAFGQHLKTGGAKNPRVMTRLGDPEHAFRSAKRRHADLGEPRKPMENEHRPYDVGFALHREEVGWNAYVGCRFVTREHEVKPARNPWNGKNVGLESIAGHVVEGFEFVEDGAHSAPPGAPRPDRPLDGAGPLVPAS